MRRFDKLKVIKEANEKIEKQFLSNKSFLIEQEVNGVTDPDVKKSAPPENADKKEKNKTPDSEIFAAAKKELNINGDTSAFGLIPGGNGKYIKINNNALYTIYTSKTESSTPIIKDAEFKLLGIVKHVEYQYPKKDGGDDKFYKLNNLLDILDKKNKFGSNVKESIISTFETLEKNGIFQPSDYSYRNFHKSKSGYSFGVKFEPNSSDDTKEGTFNFIWYNPKSGTWEYLKDAEGDYSEYGKEFTMNNKSYYVQQVGKARKGKISIDNTLVNMLTDFNNSYK
jgi:hypothetical protein